MSLHEKGRNKKMPTPRHNVTDNPIPTSLFCINMLVVCLFVCYECIRQSKQHNTCNTFWPANIEVLYNTAEQLACVY